MFPLLLPKRHYFRFTEWMLKRASLFKAADKTWRHCFSRLP